MFLHTRSPVLVPLFNRKTGGLNLQVESDTFQFIIPLHFETLFPSATTHFRPEYLGVKCFTLLRSIDIISKRSLSLSCGENIDFNAVKTLIRHACWLAPHKDATYRVWCHRCFGTHMATRHHGDAEKPRLALPSHLPWGLS